MKPKQFEKQWQSFAQGYDMATLIRYSLEELQNVPLQENTKAFLSISGLPIECSPEMGFSQKIYSSNLESLKSHLELEGDDFAHHYLIGGYDTHAICIDVSQRDAIYAIEMDYAHEVDLGEYDGEEFEGYYPVMFVNSTIEALAECLLIYNQHPTDSVAALLNLRSLLSAVDPPCIAEKALWWWESDERQISL